MKRKFIMNESKSWTTTLLFILALFFTSATFAQQVKGRVTGGENEALVGVNVTVKGTNKGT